MKKLTKHAIAITIISCLAAGSVLAATTDEEKRQGNRFPGAGELKAYRAKQRKLVKEHREECQKENQQFRESLKEKEPSSALPEIISHRTTQNAEIKTFATGLYNDFVAYAKEVAEKHDVPAEKQEEMLKKIQEHHDEMVAKHEESFKKMISALEALKTKEDLTWEDIKNVFKENRPERASNRGRGRGNGNRKNQNQN